MGCVTISASSSYHRSADSTSSFQLQEKDVMASANPDLHFNSATVSLFLPSSSLFLKPIFFFPPLPSSKLNDLRMWAAMPRETGSSVFGGLRESIARF